MFKREEECHEFGLSTHKYTAVSRRAHVHARTSDARGQNLKRGRNEKVQEEAEKDTVLVVIYNKVLVSV